jgi:hypothetical protein
MSRNRQKIMLALEEALARMCPSGSCNLAGLGHGGRR